MLKETTIQELATSKMTPPVATLTINLRALSTDDGESIRLKNALSQLANGTLTQQINQLLADNPTHLGLTVVMSTTDNDGFFLPRSSEVTTSLTILEGPDFVGILGEKQNQAFNLLALNQDSYQLFTWNKASMTPVTDTELPGSLDDTLGTEKRGGSLNFSAQGGQTSYHGHNETSQEKAIDQERYYRELLAALGNDSAYQQATYILAGLPKNTRLFRKLNSKLSLFKSEIDKSVANQTDSQLQQIVNTFVLQQMANETDAQLKDAAEHDTAVTVDDITTALEQGQVRTLYVNSKAKLESEATDLLDPVNRLIALALREGKTVSVLQEENTAVPLLQATLY